MEKLIFKKLINNRLDGFGRTLPRNDGIRALYNSGLLLTASFIIGIGFVMLFSASAAYAEAHQLSPFYYVCRQALAFVIGLALAAFAMYVPLRFWLTYSVPLLLITIIALAILLIPGVSHEVHGSTRWIFIGPISIQFSEFAKVALVIYMASFLARKPQEVREKMSGFLKPLVILLGVSGLVLLEPDFGAVVVMTATVMCMLFLGGVPFKRFIPFVLAILGALVYLLMSSPYRMARLSTFLNPWADQFNTGYQLTQSLIAFGQGAWTGVGLGNGVQKLLYLPEPHTDFLFAVIAEELGLLAAMGILGLYVVLIYKALAIGRKAILNGMLFAGHLGYGIALWLGIQTLINLGVNVGMLPTKGLTLPFMSYGSNSLLACMLALGLLFRIDFETRLKKIGYG